MFEIKKDIMGMHLRPNVARARIQAGCRISTRATRSRLNINSAIFIFGLIEMLWLSKFGDRPQVAIVMYNVERTLRGEEWSSIVPNRAFTGRNEVQRGSRQIARHCYPFNLIFWWQANKYDKRSVLLAPFRLLGLQMSS